MPKTAKIPDFNFADLLTSMQQGAAHAAGKITARTHRIKIRPAALTGADIAGIRASLNVSQAVFADLLNVPKATAVAWERGLRSPSGAAIRLLQIAQNAPDTLRVAAVACSA
ncbi:MAG: helix-turn-helix domain-containing protein [Verrucomicrobia bacterium]|nr:helix-turn-helix domain-containing protein [Verrucomicrobiota bacterium]